ncbi:hypothetical protein CDAR_522501 [Caerostris darwini]|uniref:Uncharacterized protein n=1 Tax=Caerostris darwini TaxID=1538125 RepID=A0AAV4VQW2_9ARAC|nr:hypothetical protein CDAR_522501 [Caerostris darwini]
MWQAISTRQETCPPLRTCIGHQERGKNHTHKRFMSSLECLPRSVIGKGRFHFSPEATEPEIRDGLFYDQCDYCCSEKTSLPGGLPL